MLTALVLALPASPEMQPERLAAFDMILGQSPRLMAAGIVAYGTSQFLHVTIFSKLRGPDSAGTPWLSTRGAIASALSPSDTTDRKSAGMGKRVAVLGDHGGTRIMIKKK